jgi:predicted TIM-barrel fold metal-dependent hydrolase
VTAFDVHQHLWPQPFAEALARRSQPPCLRDGELVLGEGRFPRGAEADSLADRLAGLDRDGIDVAVLSLQPTLGIDALPERERDELVEAWVGGVRELLGEAGGRLLAFAPGRVVDGFAGTSIPAAAARDRDALAPLLDGLEERSGVLFVHPGPVVSPPGAPAWWAWVADYTAQMQAAYLAWLAGGRSRWPSVRVVFAILAGGAPFQLERLAYQGVDVRSTLDPNVFLDVSTYGRRAIELCIETFGVDQLVYGSDVPVVDPARTLHAVRGFGESVHRMLTDHNPARLLYG